MDRVTTPSGRFLDFTDDADNRITAITDIAGRQVTYEYDAAGYLSRFTDAEGHSESYEYDTDGNMTRVIDRRGHVLGSMGSDQWGQTRLIQVTHLSGCLRQAAHQHRPQRPHHPLRLRRA